ncbi:hypothetical protein A7K92_27830 [Klebsiella pneumoniae]|nr:hypothetical protein A7K92_27830 [Klebsiella pneumoniae]
MTHNGSRTLSFYRTEEKRYMVLMIVSGRSGSGKSVALRARRRAMKSLYEIITEAGSSDDA